MNKIKKILCITMAISVALSFTACGNKKLSQDTKKTKQIKGDYQLPFCNDEVTLTFATNDSPESKYSLNNNPKLFEEIAKKTGVKVKFEAIPPSDYDAVMQTRLAAGQNLPDIILIPGGDIVPYVTAKSIIPITQLIEDYAPNTKKLLDSREDLKKELVYPDGNIYYIDSLFENTYEVNYETIHIRKDWLNKLGLEEPKTINDWHNVLKAFKEKDPNGNNKNDEIPITSTWLPSLYKFGWAYGLHLMNSGGWIVDENGKAVFECIQPRMKEYLTEMNKWYNEGLIDIDISNQTLDKYTSKIVGNTTGAALAGWSLSSPMWNKQMATSIPEAKWVSTVVPKGPYGDQIMEKPSPWRGWKFGISKNCSDPALAMRYLDYLFAHEEGVKYLNYGIEGVTYTIENGKIKMKENPEGENLMYSIGICGALPIQVTKEQVALGLESDYNNIINDVNKARENTKYYSVGFPSIHATKEESDELKMYMADIETYKHESIAKFILGQTPISEFDNFVSKMKSMGVDKILEIRQVQYNRAYGNKGVN